jgi:hypothetical protein
MSTANTVSNRGVKRTLDSGSEGVDGGGSGAAKDIRIGADTSVKDRFVALSSGSVEACVSYLETLSGDFLSEALATPLTEEGMSYLHVLAQNEEVTAETFGRLVRLYVGCGLGVDIPLPGNQLTPLHLTLVELDPKKVDILLKAGASPSSPDKYGSTPLMYLVAPSASLTECLRVYDAKVPAMRKPAMLLLNSGANVDAKACVTQDKKDDFVVADKRGRPLTPSSQNKSWTAIDYLDALLQRTEPDSDRYDNIVFIKMLLLRDTDVVEFSSEQHGRRAIRPPLYPTLSREALSVKATGGRKAPEPKERCPPKPEGV